MRCTSTVTWSSRGDREEKSDAEPAPLVQCGLASGLLAHSILGDLCSLLISFSFRRTKTDRFHCRATHRHRRHRTKHRKSCFQHAGGAYCTDTPPADNRWLFHQVSCLDGTPSAACVHRVALGPPFLDQTGHHGPNQSPDRFKRIKELSYGPSFAFIGRLQVELCDFQHSSYIVPHSST